MQAAPADHALVLTGDPAGGALDGAIADRAAATLADAGVEAGRPDWLAAATACEIRFRNAAPDLVCGRVREALAGRPLDVNAVPLAGRRKRLLIADMDSTIITGESLDELAALAGIGKRVAAITARAMRGEIGFEAALRERVGLLRDQPSALIERLLDRIALTGGAAALVRVMRAHGAHTALVSGGFTMVAERVRRLTGFDEIHANRLLVADGRLTGEVGEPVLGRDAKRERLHRLCADHGLVPGDAAAVGDGANDIAMLQTAGLGVAFRAKPATIRAARCHIRHGDLTALLYLQGYRAAEIRAAKAG